jgi:hypothetical protein
MKRSFRQTCLRLAAAAALAATAWPAAALDLQWSGFGTLGYAKSNRPFAWQRSITDEGSFERDTVLGGQLDLRLNPEWSATVQARLAQDEKKDNAWTPTIAWAFIAWRPDNDWLLRAGKFRVPLFLFSETQDIGTSRDMARLPNDSYTLNPVSDFTGPVRIAHLAMGCARVVGRPLFGLRKHQLPALGAERAAAGAAVGSVLLRREGACQRCRVHTARPELLGPHGLPPVPGHGDRRQAASRDVSQGGTRQRPGLLAGQQPAARAWRDDGGPRAQRGLHRRLRLEHRRTLARDRRSGPLRPGQHRIRHGCQDRLREPVAPHR